MRTVRLVPGVGGGVNLEHPITVGLLCAMVAAAVVLALVALWLHLEGRQ